LEKQDPDVIRLKKWLEEEDFVVDINLRSLRSPKFLALNYQFRLDLIQVLRRFSLDYGA
jgi:hypothetical protein